MGSIKVMFSRFFEIGEEEFLKDASGLPGVQWR
jgi:hypothetical protein